MRSPSKILATFLAVMLIISIYPHHIKTNNTIENLSGIEVTKIKIINAIREYETPINYQTRESYSVKYHKLEFGGSGVFTEYPFRTSVLGDFFRLDYRGEFEIAKAKLDELHGLGVKVILYMPFSSLSERKNFMEHWNLTPEEISAMDLNGTYYYDLPYTIGYEGREAWREFFVKFLKYIYDAGFDGIEFDGGNGLSMYGSFDPETMQKFNQYLASKYNASELLKKFNITDINTFNFTQYLRDLGYHHNAIAIDGTVIAHPGPEGPKDNQYAIALWEEFKKFNALMLIELYKLLMENVQEWERETGREFYVSTRGGIILLSLPILLYVDGVNWEYCWISGKQDYPHRTASKDLWSLRCLNKTFNLWIYPWSSLESTGFTEWYSNGWNKTSDPEEQYLALSEVIVFGGRISVTPYAEYGKGESINRTHFSQFVRLVQENPRLFDYHDSFTNVALVLSTATAMNLKKLNMTSVIEEGNYDGFEGTFYLLADSHIPFDVILFGDNIWTNTSISLTQLSKYDVIVLPETKCLTDEQVSLLEQYVQNGGIIIGVGEDIAKYNEYGESVSRSFSDYFNYPVYQLGSGLIVSIKDILPSDYLYYRAQNTRHDSTTLLLLNTFKNEIDDYIATEIETDLSPRAHVYRFFDEEETALIFHIINYEYDFDKDKAIRAYNVWFNFTLPPQLQGKDLSIWLYSEDYPEGMELTYTVIGDKVSIRIPKVSILTCIEVRPHFEYKEAQIINEPTIFKGETIYLDRNLIVNTTLIIQDSNLIIRGSIKPIGIEILPGASLYVINSKIGRETGEYYILARSGSKIFIKNSDISEAGTPGLLNRGGLCIETKNVVILDSVIHDNYHFGVLLYNSDHSIIGNNLIYNNPIGAAIVNSSYVDFFNNTVIYNNIGLCIESPDIYDAGARLRSLGNMWLDGKVPSRGAAKIVVSDCKIMRNTYTNIATVGCNFVTIKNSEIGFSNGNNIFCWEDSMTKIYNCTIHSAHNGIYLEECPVNTILNNKIYNHSFAGILIYKCTEQGVLHWNHLENLGADTRIIGNIIRNNTYGIYMDFGWGYINYFMRIQKNEISLNHIGIYLNLTQGEIYENNFIENDEQAIVGPGGGDGLFGSDIFCLNISWIYGNYPKIGNYWDDWNKSTEYYEVCLGYYDYYPLENPVEIPTITDLEGPRIWIENFRKVWVNETHYRIEFNFTVMDESYLGGGDKDNLPNFGLYHFLGPNLRQLDPPYSELEFPWLGYPGPLTGVLPGPEEKSKFFHGSFKTSELNAEWLRGAILTLYVTDMWGNWNKNDSIAPDINILYLTTDGTPMTLLNDKIIKVYCLVSDWSSLAKVKLIYSNDSRYVSTEMQYDDISHLYYCTIPPQKSGTLLKVKIYAEDIYGNNYTTAEQSYLILDLEPPRIIDVYWEPREPTEKDNVTVYANITDPSGIKIAILSYSNGSSWFNVTMTYNESTELYIATILNQSPNTEIRLKIYACDNFANWAESETYSYTVVKSKAPQPSNILLYIAGISAIIIIAIGIIIILRKK